MEGYRSERSPGFKLGLAIVVGFLLTIPLFSIYLLAYDRESQSREAAASITAGWGGSQTMSGLPDSCVASIQAKKPRPLPVLPPPG